MGAVAGKAHHVRRGVGSRRWPARGRRPPLEHSVVRRSHLEGDHRGVRRGGVSGQVPGCDVRVVIVGDGRAELDVVSRGVRLTPAGSPELRGMAVGAPYEKVILRYR